MVDWWVNERDWWGVSPPLCIIQNALIVILFLHSVYYTSLNNLHQILNAVSCIGNSESTFINVCQPRGPPIEENPTIKEGMESYHHRTPTKAAPAVIDWGAGDIGCHTHFKIVLEAPHSQPKHFLIENG